MSAVTKWTFQKTLNLWNGNVFGEYLFSERLWVTFWVTYSWRIAQTIDFTQKNKADDGNWTRDPFLTKEVLYLWATSACVGLCRSQLFILADLSGVVNIFLQKSLPAVLWRKIICVFWGFFRNSIFYSAVIYVKMKNLKFRFTHHWEWG